MTRLELATKIIIEWLNANTYMPVYIERQIIDLVEEMNGDGPDGPDGAA